MLYLRSFNRFILVSMALLGLSVSSVNAGFVTSFEVSIDRFQDGTYNFNSDIFGSVSEFQSITLTSPLNNQYSLGLADEGDQWDSGEQGTAADITSEFVDGDYRFDIVYTDATTESRIAQLGGSFPIFPSSLSLTGNTVSWDTWINPVPLSHIELTVFETNGTGEFFANLNAATNSYDLPLGFIQLESQYDLELWFLTSETSSSHKSSVSEITTVPAVPVPAAVWLFGTALIGFVGISRRRKIA